MKTISVTIRRPISVLGVTLTLLITSLVFVAAAGAGQSRGERIALRLSRQPDVAAAFRNLDHPDRAVIRQEALALLRRLEIDARMTRAPRLTPGQRALFTVAVATARPVPSPRVIRGRTHAQDIPVFDAGADLRRWKSRWRGKRVRCWGITGRWDLKSFSLVKIAELWQRTHVCSRKRRVRIVRIPRAHRGYDTLVPLLSFQDLGGSAHNAGWEGRGFYRLEAIAGYGPFAARQTHCLQLRLNRKVNVYSSSISCHVV